MVTNDVTEKVRNVGDVMRIYYDNNDTVMLCLPIILNSRSMKDTIFAFLSHRKSPMVSYSYSNTVSGIYDEKRVVEELDFDVATENMLQYCACSICHVMCTWYAEQKNSLSFCTHITTQSMPRGRNWHL